MISEFKQTRLTKGETYQGTLTINEVTITKGDLLGHTFTVKEVDEGAQGAVEATVKDDHFVNVILKKD